MIFAVQFFAGKSTAGQVIFAYSVLCYGFYVLSDAGECRYYPGRW